MDSRDLMNRRRTHLRSPGCRLWADGVSLAQSTSRTHVLNEIRKWMKWHRILDNREKSRNSGDYGTSSFCAIRPQCKPRFHKTKTKRSVAPFSGMSDDMARVIIRGIEEVSVFNGLQLISNVGIIKNAKTIRKT